MAVPGRSLRQSAALAVVCMIGSTLPAQEASHAERNPPRLNCGVKSLGALLRILGVPGLSGPWQRVVDVYGVRDSVSLADLVAAARELGVELSGREVTLEELSTKRVPALVHLAEGHFATFVDTTAGVARWVDGEKGLMVAPAAEFARGFSGYCLLPGVPIRTQQAPGGPVFPELHHDVGRLEPGQEMRHSFRFTNAGEVAVRIGIVRTSRGCTATAVGGPTVQPGDSGVVALAGPPPAGASAARLWAELATSDAARRVVYLTLDALGPVPVDVHPERLAGTVRKGEGIRWRILVRTPGETRVRAVAAEPDEWLEASFGEVLDAGGGEVGVRYVAVAVRATAHAPVGVLRGRVTLTTDDPHTPVVVVPVTLRVQGQVEVMPPDIFFGVVRQGEGATREIVVRAPGCAEFEVTRVRGDPRCVEAGVPIRRRDGSYAVAVQLRPHCRPGALRGRLEVDTNLPGEDALRVAVYAQIIR